MSGRKAPLQPPDMEAEFYLATTANQRLSAPRMNCPDAPTWDEVEVRYLCTGDIDRRGGYSWEMDFPGVPGFVVKRIETEPIVDGLYYTTLGGAGVKQKRSYQRILPSSGVITGQDVTVRGEPGPNPDKSWPSVEIYVAGIAMEVTYVGAEGYSESTANNPARKIGSGVNTPLVIPGFKPVAFPPAPPNPWYSIPERSARLLSPAGWVVTKAEGPPLTAGINTGPHLLTVGYLHRWRIIPG